MRLCLAIGLGILVLALGAPARAGSTLDRVKAAGSLRCGVLTEPEDWDKSDVHAALPAFDADLCRGVAAAVLGSPDRVVKVELPAEQSGFAALRAGTIDVLMGATPAPSATLAFGVAFARPVFLDGDGVLVHREAGIARFEDLGGRLVCYAPETPSAEVLDSEAGRRAVPIRRWAFEERGEMLAAVAGRNCDALFGPVTRLVAGRNSFHARAKDFILLPDRLSVVPMSPSVVAGDPAWLEIVDAVAGAPLLAESAGVTKATAATLATTEDPLLRPLAGLLPGIDAATIGPGWGTRVIASVGNSGELYDRDLGPGSSVGLPRGPNALWTQGGLMVPPRLP